MISVVIPTLGKFNKKNLNYQILKNTEDINFEVIFSVPKKNYSKLYNLIKYKNVKVVSSNDHNQVRQRLEAIKVAKYSYILQLDDDIQLEEKFLTKIYKSSKKIKGNFCLSPILRDNFTKKIIYKEVKALRRLLYLLLFQIDITKNHGKISNFGLAFDFSPHLKKLQRVEWLPGGCMLTKKIYYKNYNVKIFHNYEKAYCEDVYFSLTSGFKKYIDYGLSAYLINETIPENLTLQLKYVYSIYKLNKNKNIIKFFIFVLLKCLKKIF